MKPLFVLLAFAAYRLTRVLVDDKVADGLRTWVMARYGNEGLGALVDCPFCAGWWISGVTVASAIAVGLLPRQLRMLLLWWPAVAGAQALLSAIDAWLEGGIKTLGVLKPMIDAETRRRSAQAG